MADRAPDPKKPGTVYRSRPRLRRGGKDFERGSLRGNGAGPSSGTPVYDDGTDIPDSLFGENTSQPYGSPRPSRNSDARQAGDVYAAYGGTRTPERPSAYGPGGAGGPGGRGPGGPAGRGTPPPAAPRRRRRFRLRVLVPLVLLVLVAYPVLLGLNAWRSVNRVDAVAPAHAAADPGEQPGRTYLVVGSDARDDLTPEEKKRLGTGSVAGQRTDTIMLLRVPAGGGPTVLVSIPRDSYVPIPGRGSNKINAAFAFGGPSLLIRTVEEVTGVRVDDYVQTGLGGFSDIVDAIGGVRICPKFDMDDEKAHINLKKGCQDVDGPTALGYARARYSDPRGDLGRVERQREVLAAIASKTLSPGTLAQPWRAFPASSSGGGALTIDENMGPLSLARFVLAMRAVSGSNGLTLTVPVSDPSYSTPAGEAVKWDTDKALQLFASLKTDDTEAIRPLAEEQKATSE